jgi:hypothetical protein
MVADLVALVATAPVPITGTTDLATMEVGIVGAATWSGTITGWCASAADLLA